MAAGRRKSGTGGKKKGFLVKFELSLPGLLGLGVVCFCIFLWMYLLGIWSGQSLFPSGQYRPAESAGTRPGMVGAAAPEGAPAEKAVAAPLIAAEKKELQGGQKKRLVSRQDGPAPEPEEDPAFFAVQVGAFKDGELAGKEVVTWKNKGYNSFSRPPAGEDDKFTRVYVGRFDSLAAARDEAAAIGGKEEIKPFVVLIPGE